MWKVGFWFTATPAYVGEISCRKVYLKGHFEDEFKSVPVAIMKPSNYWLEIWQELFF